MHILLVILHIVGAGVLVGVVVFSLIISRKALSPELQKIAVMMRNLGTAGAAWQLVTGLVLYFEEPEEFRESAIFWVKIGLFVLDGLVAVLIIDRKIKSASQQGQPASIPGLPLWALVNLVILLSIIVLGVLLVEAH